MGTLAMNFLSGANRILLLAVALGACDGTSEEKVRTAPARGPVVSIGLEASLRDPCTEVEVPLTQPGGESWPVSGLTFDGSLTVYLCEGDLKTLTPAVRAALRAALDEIVPQYHFLMHPICSQPVDPALAERHNELYFDDRQQVFERLNGAGAGAIRRVKCQFGWTHYDHTGEPVSGVH